MSPFCVVTLTSSYLDPRRQQLLDWVIARYAAFDCEVIIGEDNSIPFNRSRARNDGLNRATRGTVLIADGDTAFDFGAITIGLAMLEGGAPWVIPYGDYYNLTESYTNQILADPMDPIENPAWDHRIKSWAGLLIARTEDCFTVGGYDERFEGWGEEDVAFRIVMDAHIGSHRRVQDGRALHLWHPRGDDEFGTPSYLKNRALFDKEYRQKYNWRDERLR